DPGLSHELERAHEGGLVFVREADYHVTREVEVAQRRQATEERRGVVAAAHRPQNVVVAGLKRDVQVASEDRRLPQRLDELRRQVIDLDRGEPQPGQALDPADGADEAGQREAGLPVAVAAEVDAGQDNLLVALADAATNLAQDRRGAAAPRGPADERD